MRTLPHTRSCFVCGEANPAGLKLRFETDGQIVQTQFVPGTEHVGFRQTIHGGLIATVLDEIMVWACAVRTKRFAYCAELTVRFKSPLRPGEAVIAIGQLEQERRGKLFQARAELKSRGGLVLATATGKYFPIQETDLREMAGDFVGDVAWFLER